MRRLLSLLVLMLVAVAVGASPGAEPELAFRVIVHPEVEGTLVAREVLSSIFLGDEDHWADGRPVAPVDQSLRSPVRAAFSERVLGEPLDGVQALWARRISQGLQPPMVRASDEDVITYVAKTEGAVGYVSSDIALPPTVRILSILY